ncbi:hypothetical protein DZC78_12900 [Olleya aquimaris]|nr:hypothetical protein DZC78_12900 [Olleya aquimaris]
MNTITKHLVYMLLVLTAYQVSAQDQDSVTKLEEIKATIKAQEKEALKVEVDQINDQLEADEISFDEAEVLKRLAAEKRASNIENRIIIAQNRLDYLKRNDKEFDVNTRKTLLSLKIGDDDNEILGIHTAVTPPKKDIRTSNQLIFAMGFNNAIIDGVNLDDSPYKLGGSGFVELGWVWKTRVFKQSNFLRFKYGFSLQWNKLDIKDNLYFVQEGDQTTLQEFDGDLKQAKFRTTSLVLPIHFEFGPWSKKEYDDGRIRYNTYDKFKIGIGGYVGVNGKAVQKLTYKENGDRVNDKVKKSFNTNTFTYGLSAYVGFDDISLYAKYDLAPIFKNQTIDQNNISLGLRVDLD